MAVSREQWGWVTRLKARPRSRVPHWTLYVYLAAFQAVWAVQNGLDRRWVRLGFGTTATVVLAYLSFHFWRKRRRENSPG